MLFKKGSSLLIVLSVMLLFSFRTKEPCIPVLNAYTLAIDSPGVDSMILLHKQIDKGDGKVVFQKGTASYYSNKFEGKRTASGDIFSQSKFTAAHRTLALGTMVRVTNLKNNLWVDVKVNDRMGRSKHKIDLSRAAAKEIDMVRSGWANVTIEILED